MPGHFPAEKARDLADCREVEALRVGSGRLLLDELTAELVEHLGFETVEVVTRHRLRRCDSYRVTIAHFEHAAAYSDMMLRAVIVAPARHRYGERCQEIGVTRQNAKRPSIIFGPKVNDIAGLDDDSERGSDGEPHRVPPFAEASLSRASSKSPTM